MQHWIEEALLTQPKVLTGDRLRRMVPGCADPEQWADAFAAYLPRYGIESDHDVAMFLAQVGHESGSFHHLEESLNYSTEALHKLFGAHRISRVDIELLGRKKGQAANEPALANTLYGGEWGAGNLGNTEPGDGWKFRGRGLIQITGRANYEACAGATGLDIIRDPDLLVRDVDAGAVSALWFWSSFVDGRDMKSTTRQINGGYHGLHDRVKRFKRALAVLEA